MPTEFGCNGCQKQLRVSDESAGKDARCPECGAINRVPLAAAPPPAPPAGNDWQFSESGNKPSTNPFAAGATVNPYAAPQSSSYEASPVQYSSGLIQPTVVSVEPILNHAWKVWQENL